MKHHGPVFAVLLAHSIGYLDPLLARLRDTSVEKTYEELEFTAKVRAGVIKLPTGGLRRVKMYRNRLRMAAYYLEFDRGEPRRGRKVAAERFAAGKCDVTDLSEIRRAVRFAKTVAYRSERWWDIASKMARKGKIGQLHRTY
jgi:hypothetical protein